MAMKNESSPSRTQEAELERIMMLLRAPAPRVVDADIAKAAISPIANFLILMWALQTLLGLMLGITFACLFDGRYILIALILPAVMSPSLVLGLRSRRRTVRLLANGTLCKGRVLAVSPLPARINHRTFFRVRVEVRPPDGGPAITAADTVDNWAVEYFLDARDQQNDVDVLHAADVPYTVVFPARLAATRRFD